MLSGKVKQRSVKQKEYSTWAICGIFSIPLATCCEREMQFQKVLDIVYFYWERCMTFPSWRKREQDNTVRGCAGGSQSAEIT